MNYFNCCQQQNKTKREECVLSEDALRQHVRLQYLGNVSHPLLTCPLTIRGNRKYNDLFNRSTPRGDHRDVSSWHCRVISTRVKTSRHSPSRQYAVSPSPPSLPPTFLLVLPILRPGFRKSTSPKLEIQPLELSLLLKPIIPSF